MFREIKKTDNIHIRPAQIGDICLLLVPTRDEEIKQFRQHQAVLQSHYGGFPVEQIHLTCQRFYCSDEKIDDLVKDFENHLRTLHPIDLNATKLETIFSRAQHSHILKWSVNISKNLVELIKVIESRIKIAGIQPLYATGFVSSLVTSLYGITKLKNNLSDLYSELPYHLFTGEKIIFSRITGVNKFDLLDTICLDNANDKNYKE